MNKLTISLSLAAAAMLAACGSPNRLVSDSRPTYVAVPIAEANVRPGVGKVVLVVDRTGPVRSVSTQVLTVRMRDGSNQIVTQTGPQIEIGEEVRLTSNSIQRLEPIAFAIY